MTVKICIPVSEILRVKGSALIVEYDGRCSRCNQSPAGFFEAHALAYACDPKPHRLTGKKYGEIWKYTLKLALCESCYQSDFLTHPELMDQNSSVLGRIARLLAILRTIGGLLAAAGFLLLTPLISAEGVLGAAKKFWQIPVAVGVLLLLLAWMEQHKHQERIRQELHAHTPGYEKLRRAQVKAPVFTTPPEPEYTGIELILDNEEWAEEAADANHWACEKSEANERSTPPES